MKAINHDDYLLVTPSHVRFINLKGKRFGRLIVETFLGKSKSSKQQTLFWDCLCDCGQHTAVDGAALRKKQTRSCGCYQDEMRSIVHQTHRMSKSSEYIAFLEARKRCTNPKVISYPKYGGRGIKFRFDSFEQFFDCLGPKPSRKHSLDRIDVNGDYEPGNIRWANPTEQQNNTTRNRWISIDGVTKTLSEWSRLTGIDVRMIDTRMRKLGWCANCAVYLKKPERCKHRQQSK